MLGKAKQREANLYTFNNGILCMYLVWSYDVLYLIMLVDTYI